LPEAAIESIGELVVDRASGVVAVPNSAGRLTEVESNAAALRERIRFDGGGRYRPLSGARTLPRGWFVRMQRPAPTAVPVVRTGPGVAMRGERYSVTAVRAYLESKEALGIQNVVRAPQPPSREPEQLLTEDEVVETVYPLATVHRAQYADGTLRVVTLDDVIGRQQGRYRSAAELDGPGRERARTVVCGACVRRPVWAGEVSREADIPCPEPCSVLLAFVREAAEWQRERPAQLPADPAVPFAAFDKPGNELREAWLRLSSG
jgi:hypothetical protein